MNDPTLHFLKEADLVLAVGASLTRGSTLTANLPAGKVLIQVGNDPTDIGKSYCVDHPPLGDAKSVLGQLIEALKDRQGKHLPRKTGKPAAEITRLRAAWLEQWRSRLESNETPLNAYRVIGEFMSEVDPADAIVTHDAGSPRDQLVPFYRATRPHAYLGWGKSHGLGAGVGLSMGAKRADPEKLCVHFMGDAAFGMTGLDLETAVRTGLPTLSMVFKNSTMAIELHTLVRSHELYKSRDLGGEYCEIAKALGLHAERVERPEDIRPAIRRARKATQGGTAALIEFITSDEVAFSNYQALSGV